MNGFRVNDQPGYDMHGLPVEVKVEKELGIKNKKEIEDKIGVAMFVQACKEFSSKNMDTMSKQFTRLGVWMDWEHPYMTTTDDYISSVWWAIKQAHQKKRLYRGLKVVTTCPRCATALAKHELDYKTVKENSIYIKFPVAGKKDEYILVWTTTPWTLPGNTGIMAHPDFDYLKIKVEFKGRTEHWWIVKALANAVMAVLGYKYQIEEEVKGQTLEGVKYEPPLGEEVPENKKLKNAHRIVMSEEYVHTEGGTGFVHCAPGHGPEDFEVGKKTGLPTFCPVNDDGTFSKQAGKYAGLKVKKDDPKIVEDLNKKNLLIGDAEIEHEYAHCWRCESPIIYLAVPQWFISVEPLKDMMLKFNEKIKWVPEWAGNQSFRSWLEGLVDWCISRQRYWGIPLPIWTCDKCKTEVAIGSRAELEKLAKVPELHKPWVDDVTWKCKCGGIMRREPDIVDVWLDSAAATWASFGSNPIELEKKGRWPCDWIIEGKDQIRGWFYSQMGLSTVSVEKPPYKAVFMHGHIQDEQGRKMSKSLGNYISPEEVIEKYGSEPLRWYFIMGCSPGDDLSYGWGHTELAMRNLDVLANIFLFAQRDWKVAKFSPSKFTPKRIEDKWILSRANTVTKKVTDLFENYNLPEIPRVLEEFFLNDLSRWYIKMIRDRTWVSASGEDKDTALQVLYAVLERLIKLVAPIVPLLSDHIYLNVMQTYMKLESVHLFDWPEAGKSDPELEGKMKLAQSAVEAALSAREAAGVKLRHPLDELVVSEDLTGLEDVICKMANVKTVKFNKDFKPSKNFQEGTVPGIKVWLNITPSEETVLEAVMRELMREVQVQRKKAGLKVEDKISLSVTGDKKAVEAVQKFEAELKQKTGCKDIKYVTEKPVVDYEVWKSFVKTNLGELKFKFEKV